MDAYITVFLNHSQYILVGRDKTSKVVEEKTHMLQTMEDVTAIFPHKPFLRML